MFFPIRTDRRNKRTPWVNYALIGANVAIFLIGGQAHTRFYLWPDQPELWQFISYQFLHSNWPHLLGNMVFLWVFGNAVEDRLGRAGYLSFYLAGGVVAGLGHAMVELNPVLGASGAVAAVTGAYLVLFPLTNVTILFWFIIIGAFEISSLVLILFRIINDIVFYLLGLSGVAYLAHLAGYGFGFAAALGLLVGRVLPREPYDLISLIAHRRRRAEFRRLAKSGYQPWEGSPAPQPAEPAGAAQANQQQIADLRQQIGRALTAHDTADAARRYRELLELDQNQVLNQQPQLDVANQLMSEGRYAAAATAYELFLKHYANYAGREQIELILGLIYARYLHQPERARQLLTAAARRLDSNNRTLAEQVLRDLPATS